MCTRCWLELHTIWWPKSKDFPELKQKIFGDTAFQDAQTRPVYLFSLLFLSLWRKNILYLHFPNLLQKGETSFDYNLFRTSLNMILWAFLKHLEVLEFTKVFLLSKLLTDSEFLPKFMVSEFITWQTVLFDNICSFELTIFFFLNTSLKFCYSWKKSSLTIASCLYLYWIFPQDAQLFHSMQTHSILPL